MAGGACVVVSGGGASVVGGGITASQKLGVSKEQKLKLMDKGNAVAFYHLAGCYAVGSYSLPQDWNKASELWNEAGELGFVDPYYNLGSNYSLGRGVEVDMKKAKHYWELAAIGGSIGKI